MQNRKATILQSIASGEFKRIYDEKGSHGLAEHFQITRKQLYQYFKFAGIPYRHSKNKIEYPSQIAILDALTRHQSDLDAAKALGVSDSFAYALRKLYTVDVTKFNTLYELTEYSKVSIVLVCRDFAGKLPLGLKPERDQSWPDALTDEKISNLYLNQRRGYNSIAKEYNIPHRKVLKKLKELGIYSNSSHRLETNEGWLKTQIESGKTLLQIGKENGISDSTIGKYARKFDIPYDKASCIWQERIVQFIQSLGVNVISNDRKIIGPLEIDIWCPDFNIGIECNGCKWHSDDGTTKSRNKHLVKFQKCQGKGIKLFQIFDSEFYDETKWSRWRSFFRHQFMPSYKIGARQCKLIDIDRNMANTFHEAWHLQGQTRLSEKSQNYGLTFRDELLAVASFDYRFGRFELSRLTFRESYRISGGASKLHSRITERVYTLSDNRYAAGSIYTHCGYVLEREVRPGYFYASHSFPYAMVDKRKYRTKTFKESLEIDPGITEFENMTNNRYYRVWDAGYKLWSRSN